MSSAKKQTAWINCVKAMAIIAVVVDHTYNISYSNRYIQTAFYFSVTLFILISGYSSYLSVENKQIDSIDISLKSSSLKLIPLLTQYTIATLVIHSTTNLRFDLIEFLNRLISFDISDPFYYIFFFIQLKLITPIIIRCLKRSDEMKSPVFFDIIILLLLFVFSVFAINFTTMLPLYGGGGYLLGGTYLPVYYIGMLFVKYKLLGRLSKTVKKIILIPLLAFCCIWSYMNSSGMLTLDSTFAPLLGEGINPPGIQLIIYTTALLFLFYCTFSLMENCNNKIVNYATNFVCYIGKNSLSIFLYHLLILTLLRTHIPFLVENVWLSRFVVFPSMIIFPCLMVYLMSLIMNKTKFFLKI